MLLRTKKDVKAMLVIELGRPRSMNREEPRRRIRLNDGEKREDRNHKNCPRD
jgi:hypothetical protein